MTARPTDLEDVDVTRAWIEHYGENAHHALVAKVHSYDASKQVADLEPMVKHAVAQADGTTDYEDLPILPAVPVLWPRAGKWFVAGCLSPGDFVHVTFTDAAFEHWRAGAGDKQYPGDLRRNHLANATCEPTNLYPRSMALAHAPSTPSLVIGCDDPSGPRITMRADGTIELAGTSFVALANLVQQQLVVLLNAITAAAVAPMDGGASFKAAILATLATADWPASMASTTAKAG